MAPTWNVRAIRSSRVFLNADLDEPLTILVDELPARLALLPKSDRSNDTLVLVLRSVTPWDNFDGILDSDGGQVIDRHGVLVLGGLSYAENCQAGADIGNESPVRFIEQTCLALAKREHDPEVARVYLELIEKKKKEDKRKADAIKRRSRKILMSLLDETQQAEFKKRPSRASGKGDFAFLTSLRKSFHVLGKDGFTYLITEQYQHNVFRIENGRRTFEYCIITKKHIPIYDQMLAQKLLLESNPQMFLDISNIWLLTEDGQRIPQIKNSPLNPESSETDGSLWPVNEQQL